MECRLLLAASVSPSPFTLSTLAASETPASFDANPGAFTTASASTTSTVAATTSSGTSSTPAAAPATKTKIRVGAAVDLIAVSGPGALSTRMTKQGLAITLFGTDDTSQLTITQTRPGAAKLAKTLVISQLSVRTGQIGSINAGLAELNGPTTGLGTVNAITFGALGSSATIDVNGDLNTLNIGSVSLGSAGRLHVAGDVTGSVTLGNVDLLASNLDFDGTVNAFTAGNLYDGPKSDIDFAGDITGALVLGTVTLSGGNLYLGGSLGSLSMGNATIGPQSTFELAGAVSGSLGFTNLDFTGGDLTFESSVGAFITNNITMTGGSLTFEEGLGTWSASNVTAGSSSSISVDGDVTGAITLGNLDLAGGDVSFSRDVVDPINVPGNLTVAQGGALTVGRDLSSLVVGGNLVVGDGKAIVIGRNLTSLTVQGNLETTAGAEIYVTGNLGSLAVSGVIDGDYNADSSSNAPNGDLYVGLDLGSLSVAANIPAANPGTELGDGGVYHFDINVIKSIQNLDISHGLFNSRITAGVSINGGTPTNDTYNIGPDGVVAVLDSLITAGASITKLTIAGDVESDQPTNAAGSPTRIIAGVDRSGNFAVGGTIDNFQIIGNLVDAVLAASVEPSPTRGIYDAPGGSISGTISVGEGYEGPFTYDNFTAPPFASASADDVVLEGGSINASFIGVPTQFNPKPFPTESTVTGTVITTAGSKYDHAGIFAIDTQGVFVGALPVAT